jgi:hypothetical protein
MQIMFTYFCPTCVGSTSSRGNMRARRRRGGDSDDDWEPGEECDPVVGQRILRGRRTAQRMVITLDSD